MKWKEVMDLLSNKEFLELDEVVYFFSTENEGKEFEEISVDFDPYHLGVGHRIDRESLFRCKEGFTPEEQRLLMVVESIGELSLHGFHAIIAKERNPSSLLYDPLNICFPLLVRMPVFDAGESRVLMFEKKGVFQELICCNRLEIQDRLRAATSQIKYVIWKNTGSVSCEERNLRELVALAVIHYLWSENPKLRWKQTVVNELHFEQFSVMSTLQQGSRQIRKIAKSLIPDCGSKNKPPKSIEVIFPRKSDGTLGVDFRALRIVTRTIIDCYFYDQVEDIPQHPLEEIRFLFSIRQIDERLTDIERVYFYYEIEKYVGKILERKRAMKSFKELLSNC